MIEIDISHISWNFLKPIVCLVLLFFDTSHNKCTSATVGLNYTIGTFNLSLKLQKEEQYSAQLRLCSAWLELSWFRGREGGDIHFIVQLG